MTVLKSVSLSVAQCIICCSLNNKGFDQDVTVLINVTRNALQELQLPYFSIDNARVIYTKISKFVKNENARYTLERYER